ncbi:alpha/beta hydrolase [Novosphingobium sp. NBM11]|uniref:RBBP9/YdeN family alpha/beta hydrolase n=1 Tax=Novosphingobium sp. NBM11 TaxID=2596914 RepID=UPI00189209AA|nr:alpha/beta hydrolase [Novosphingobium sp. NBM11]MBF5089912.1 alpha/beta hydrolase [Novosphingobium sp. NBM11]
MATHTLLSGLPSGTNTDREPLVLTVPGLNNSGPGHWQTIWEQEFDNCHRVDLGLWDDPLRNTWVNKLNLAIQRADRPVVLVAHSLGCLAVAWWAEYEQPGRDGPVVGALLVAPPDVEERALDRRLTRFAPFPPAELPFPSILVASRNDPYLRFGAARRLATTWGSRFADAGPAGHINAESGLGEWAFGQLLLSQLLPDGLRSAESGKRPLPRFGSIGEGRAQHLAER